MRNQLHRKLYSRRAMRCVCILITCEMSLLTLTNSKKSISRCNIRGCTNAPTRCSENDATFSHSLRPGTRSSFLHQPLLSSISRVGRIIPPCPAVSRKKRQYSRRQRQLALPAPHARDRLNPFRLARDLRLIKIPVHCCSQLLFLCCGSRPGYSSMELYLRCLLAENSRSCGNQL
jgi:hypothetical protein